MPAKSNSNAKVLEAIESLRHEVVQLKERVAMLETATAAPDSGTSFPEDLLLTVSAAVAAYLGVQPTIRQIRLLHSNSWAQQGRATIQASHSFTIHQF